MAMAISIRQPWAHAIVHMGKRVENRTWSTRYRGPIYIHAAKSMKRDEYDSFVWWYNQVFSGSRYYKEPPAIDSLPRGGIVAKAEIIDCIRSQYALPHGITREQGDRFIVPWWQGPYGIVLAKVEPVEFIACNGKLSIYEIDDALKLEMS